MKPDMIFANRDLGGSPQNARLIIPVQGALLMQPAIACPGMQDALCRGNGGAGADAPTHREDQSNPELEARYENLGDGGERCSGPRV